MSDLKLTGRREENLGLVVVGGELRTEIASKLHDLAQELFGEGAQHLLLDFGRVMFMDSASLAILIRLDGQIKERGGRMVLYGLTRSVARVLDNSGLNERFAIAKDEAEARAIVA